MEVVEIAAGIAVLAGAALQSATGFGFALVSAPLLFAATDPARAVGLLILLGLLVNLMTLGTEGRRPQPLVRDSMTLLAWAVPGVAAGLLALRSLDSTALQVGVTLGVFATLAVRALARRRRDAGAGEPPWWAAPATGFVSGALTTSTNTAGPPVVLYMLARGATPVETRDTLTATFVGFSVLGMAALLLSGSEGAIPRGDALAALVPAVVAGHLAGRPVFARIADHHYEPALTAVLILTALGGLATALL
ncbi:MAG: sulfite exporter TauE/SafE family protein [Solirubrobacteraceae bacterium]